VREVLAEVGADGLHEVVVLNQCDRADPDALDDLERTLRELRHADPVRVSALTGAGMDELRVRIARDLEDPRRTVQVHLPYGREDLLAKVHREGHVLDVRHDASGTLLSADVDEALLAELEPFMDRSTAGSTG